MKFKVTSLILASYALIGLGMVVFSNYEGTASIVICILFYVLIPALGAYGTFVKSSSTIVILILFFIFQTIRNVENNSLTPHLAPISISFPFGNFSNAQGYLIDYFAIFMAIFLAWLLKTVVTHKKS